MGLVKVSILIMEALFRWTWTGTGASSPLKQLKISFIDLFIHSFNIHFLLKIRRRREDIIIKTLHKTKPFSLRAHNRFFDAVGKHILLLFFFFFSSAFANCQWPLNFLFPFYSTKVARQFETKCQPPNEVSNKIFSISHSLCVHGCRYL